MIELGQLPALVPGPHQPLPWDVPSPRRRVPLHRAAVAVASSAVSSTASGTSLAVTAPSGINDGDLLLIWIGHAVDLVVPTAPSGWELVREPQVGDTVHLVCLFYKWASSESGSYTFSGMTTGAIGALAMRITGADASDPFYNHVQFTQTGVGGAVAFTPLTAFGPVFTIDAGWLDIQFEAYQRGSTSDGTTPSGYSKTSVWDVGGTGSGGTRGFAFYKSVTPANGYQVGTHTPANGVAVAYICLYLRPSGNPENAPRFIGSTSSYSNGAGSRSVAPPAGTKVGDLLVAFASKRNGSGTWNTPTGWNKVGDSSTNDASPAHAVTGHYWRLSNQDSETGSGWTFSLSSGTAEVGLIVATARGVDPTVLASNSTPDNTSDVTHNIGGLTVSAQRMWLFTAIATNANSGSDGNPSGYRLMETAGGAASNMSIYGWQKFGTAANPAAVSTTGSSRKNTAWQVAYGGYTAFRFRSEIIG